MTSARAELSPQITRIEGKPHRSFAKRCECGFSDAVIVNSTRDHGGDNEQLRRIIMRKFTDKGWEVGKKRDLCPACVEERNSAHPPKTKEVKPIKETIMPETNVVPMQRRMERADRVVIIAKLMDVYESETAGYKAGWSDTRVAADLAVPVEWVSLLRDENFGSIASNPEVEATLEVGYQLLRSLKSEHDGAKSILAARKDEFYQIFNAQSAEFAANQHRIEAFEKKLDDLAKVLRS